MDESVKQLELPHLHFDGEDQWEMWANPEPGETKNGCLFVFHFIFYYLLIRRLLASFPKIHFIYLFSQILNKKDLHKLLS